MDQVSIWDLLEAFDTVCKSIGKNPYTGHIKDDTPIDLYQIEILHRLQTEGPLTFERIFESRPNRLVMVGIFLAMLELIRDKLVWAEQTESSPHQIYLRALTDEPAEEAVRRAILVVDESDDTPSRMEAPQQPPIPITEIPATAKRPAEPSPVEETTEAETPPAESPEAVTDAAEQESSAAEEAENDAAQPPAAPTNRPPIPIVEIPAQRKPRVPEPDRDKAVEHRDDTTERDFGFDSPSEPS